MAGLGGFTFNIAPGTHQAYRYERAINTDGRIIQLLGHSHEHGIRETAWIKRASGECDIHSASRASARGCARAAVR